MVQSSLIFYACSRGFGTSISLLKDGRLDQIQAVSCHFIFYYCIVQWTQTKQLPKLIATSDIIALIIIYLSKCCVVAIYLRLTPQKPHNRASWATLALCTAWVIPAIFIVLVNCELNTPWRSDGGQCNDLVCKITNDLPPHQLPEAVPNLARIVHTMAIHRCSRRYNRNPPLPTSRDPPKRPLHVRSPQTSRRLRVYIPLSVSNPHAHSQSQTQD